LAAVEDRKILSRSLPQGDLRQWPDRRDDTERRVLAGLTDKPISPEAVAVAVRAYTEESNRQNHQRRAQVEATRRVLEKIKRGIKGILDAIEDGMYQPAMKKDERAGAAEGRVRETSCGGSARYAGRASEHR
jgi:hypothetical protein